MDGPRLRRNLIERPRLTAHLEEAAAVTLVSAPTGYGKTVAVAHWLRSRSGPSAWVTVEPADNDPQRLWARVAAALGQPHGGDIDTLPDAPIVLDDVHLLHDGLEALEHAARVLGRLVLITRRDPPLRLGRLRAQGQLSELRAPELAMTAEEARALGTTDPAVFERTEGWPAGLSLAARTKTGFSGAHQFVRSYLVTEVLDALDADTRDFLRRSSVLPRLSAALCDDVLERTGSGAVLARLERSNVFTTPIDPEGRWFRYHTLFRELLATELEDPAPLHRRAAAWFRARHYAQDAIEQASAAGDHDLVAELLEEHHLTLARGGRADMLLRWVHELPEQLRHEHPGVMTAAMVAVGGQVRPEAEAQRLLVLARRARTAARWSSYHETVAQLLEATSTADAGTALAAAHRAVGLAEDANACMAHAVLSSAWLLAGDFEAAERSAKDALTYHPAPHGAVGAHATLAIVAAARERLTVARGHADRALAAADAAGIGESRAGVRARLADAVVACDEGRLKTAQRAAEQAVRSAAGFEGGVLQAWIELTFSRIQVKQGRLLRARRSLTRARELLAASPDPGWLTQLATEVTAELATAGAGTRADTTPSPAELAVLRLLATEHSLREIGVLLYLSVNTVRSHRQALYRKLGVSTRADAVARAAALGLLGSSG